MEPRDSNFSGRSANKYDGGDMKTTFKDRVFTAIKRQGPDGIEMEQLRLITGKTQQYLSNTILTLKQEGKITSPRQGFYVCRNTTKKSTEA
jgi:hypothetical protein